MGPGCYAPRRLLATLIAAGAALLAACATSPSGHYHFALASGSAQVPSQWSLRSLPRHGRIHLAARIREEVNPDQVTRVILGFGDPEATFPLANLDMADPGCQGSYSFSVEYLKDRSTSTVDYFDGRLLWGAPLTILAEWWPDGRLQLEIGDVGKQVFNLREPIDRIQIRVLNGGLREGELDFENLSDS